MLQLLHDYFTSTCICCLSISQDISITSWLFHRILQLLHGYFTGCCNCFRTISLALAFAACLFHRVLQLLPGYFTSTYTCYPTISPKLTISCDIASDICTCYMTNYSYHFLMQRSKIKKGNFIIVPFGPTLSTNQLCKQI